MFFKAQALWDMKDFTSAAESFKSLLKEYPDTRWVQLVYFYLGNSYEKLNQTEKAINTYKRINTFFSDSSSNKSNALNKW